MASSTDSTAVAVSADSGFKWTQEGAWRVLDGIHRIPLPLPMDGLKAINVYVLESDDGLTLVDGGWAIEVARAVLDRCLGLLGYRFADIQRFLVTHVHRDHYTMARALGNEYGSQVLLGADERPALDIINDDEARHSFQVVLSEAGAADIAEQWALNAETAGDPANWRYPDSWFEGDTTVQVGTRVLDAVHTPGHTPGHYVFADRQDKILFAGDHVLPTITPSIGFTMPQVPNPLGDFVASLTKVRAMPDLQILPAHGPIAPSSHTRVDELLHHHEHRLRLVLSSLQGRERTARDVTEDLPWTRHDRSFTELDAFNQGMAVMETKAHLDLLVARREAVLTRNSGLVCYHQPTEPSAPGE